MHQRENRKFIALFAALSVLFVLLHSFFDWRSAAAEETPPIDAEDLTSSAFIRALSNPDVGKITDSSSETSLLFETRDTILITAKKAVSSLYIIWEDVPDPWTLSEGGILYTCGQNGFLHEYIRLSGAQTEIALDIPAGAAICEISLYTKGTLPDFVQIWNPPCERAALLLFPTHGDDEHLFFGGIMPYYAGERKLCVQVAYLTNHKYTEKRRVHEILNGLWTVGVRAYPVFSEFKDLYAGSLEEAETIYDSEAVCAWQVEQIRRFRPSVIVGHDFGGEYGHGAHMLNAQMLAKAVPAAADSAQYAESSVRYGAWDTPKLYIHLYQENTLYLDWENLKLQAFGGRTALEMAREGYRCHESQQHWSFAVLTDGYGDCRCFGLYRSTVGADLRKTDLFENIRTEPEPTSAPTPTRIPVSIRVTMPATGAAASAVFASPSFSVPSVSARNVAFSEKNGRRFLPLMAIPAAALLFGGTAGRLLIRKQRKKKE